MPDKRTDSGLILPRINHSPEPTIQPPALGDGGRITSRDAQTDDQLIELWLHGLSRHTQRRYRFEAEHGRTARRRRQGRRVVPLRARRHQSACRAARVSGAAVDRAHHGASRRDGRGRERRNLAERRSAADPVVQPGRFAVAGDAALADAPEAITPLDPMSPRTSGGAIAIVGRALAGHPLKLHVAASSSPMQVELQDETGGTLAETTIAPRATTAMLPLPPAAATTTYFVALHYARNGGEETVVRTVIAAAH